MRRLIGKQPRKNLKACLVLVSLVLTVLLQHSSLARAAGVTFNFSYSGRLTETNGKPIRGPVALSVAFYRAATGGTPVLTVTDGLAQIPLQEGIFQITLALSGSTFQQVFPSVLESVYVEITDLTNRPDKPYDRQAVAMVPYAAKVPVDDKTIAFDEQGRASLTVSGTATAGKLLSADGSGGLAWTDPPAVTVTSVGGATADSIALATTAANAATSLATASTIVKRDSTGGFTSDNLLIQPANASQQGVIVKGASAQTAALQEWQNANGDVLAAIDASGSLKLRDGDSTANYVSLKSPATMGADVSYTLPASPVAGNFLRTDASGVLSWASPSGSGDMTAAVYDTNSDQIVDRSEDGQKFVNGSGWAGAAPATLTTLTATLAGGDTSASVVSTAGYPSAGILLIDNEFLSYSGKDSTHFTGLTRGLLATSAASHASSTAVNNLLLSAAASATDPKFVVTGQGRVGLGTSRPGAYLELAATSNIVGQIIRGSASQSAALSQWQANDGTIVATIEHDGALNMKGNALNYVALKAGTAMSSDLSFTLPSTAGASGNVLQTDGAGILSWVAPMTASGTATLTGKTLDAASNTFTNLDDSTIKASAAITRSKLASGTASHVVINDGSGVLSSEAQLAVSRGGTGAATLTSNGVLLGNGTSAVTATSAGSASTVLTVPSGGGTPTFATLVDANISSSAAIARTKIATGSNDHVLVNSATGELSSEAQLSLSRGGTGADLHASGGAGQYLKQSSAGGAISVGTIAAADYPAMGAAGVATAGTQGAVPAPAAGDQTKFLRGDGTWQSVAAGSMSIGGAISSATAGSVLFADGSGNLGQSNANIFWDNTNSRLGLGTTSPGHKFEISNSATGDALSFFAYNSSSTDAANSSSIALGRSSGHIMGKITASNSANGSFSNGYLAFSSRIGDAVTERMRISGANIGIGTTAPTETLDVRNSVTIDGDAQYIAQFMDTRTANTGIGGGISFAGYYNGTSSIAPFASIKGIKENPTSGDYAGALVMTTRVDGAVPAERLRISSAGNVGIGTSSPTSTLTVAGAVRNASSTSNAGTTINFSSSNLQYTSSDCGAFNLHNLKDGGSYTLAVQGTTAATCSFSAFSDAGSTALTVRMPSGHGATTVSKHTLYTFLTMGSHVYVAWIPGY